MMGGMAVRSLGLADGKGVQFYKFDQIPSTKDYITEWYQVLNNLQLTETEKQAIVDEANYVFALNIAIFEELEGSPFKAMWTLAINTLKLKLGLN
jgi:heme oxygenase (biliverdin-producing, ferredoxin)